MVSKTERFGRQNWIAKYVISPFRRKLISHRSDISQCADRFWFIAICLIFGCNKHIRNFVGLQFSTQNKPWLSVMSLSGKVALVTGASRGIGKGIALQLGEAGATVYITGRSLEIWYCRNSTNWSTQPSAEYTLLKNEWMVLFAFLAIHFRKQRKQFYKMFTWFYPSVAEKRGLEMALSGPTYRSSTE